MATNTNYGRVMVMAELLDDGVANRNKIERLSKQEQDQDDKVKQLKIAPARAHASPMLADKPRVNGKFLFVGKQKLYIKGVTYGTFKSQDDGSQFPSPHQVDEDFQSMVSVGINAIRTYTVPPEWLLDAAGRHGLYVMVGIPWEQHITFLDDKDVVHAIRQSIRAAAVACANHPATLCFSIGNEIPSTIVRWYGRKRIERFLKSLYRIIKNENPQSLVTYVNFPTTEYLQLGFLDFLSFNVYLESRDRLAAYLAQLQSQAGEKPLLMAEIGFDSKRSDELTQAKKLQWQISTAFRSGCIGTFVFAWTDEWYRGGFEIVDWDFGLTRRNREAKAALVAVKNAFSDSPFPYDTCWPGFSVVVCSYNGSATIRETLDALERLEYPDYEVIVVDDGSTDHTPSIAAQYDVSVIRTENCGLSSARNTGFRSSTKELIAYIDDDAFPDPDWLHYLAVGYMDDDVAGVGGPNFAPVSDNLIADCVANAPGGPIQVLLSDTRAEHIPGCNMSFRRSTLDAVGGFDPRFRTAGDDVDICWRVQDQVGAIGFHPAALDWHHRRNTLTAYWKQQKGYGQAEALLQEKWPEKYNAIGHICWRGRMYGKGFTKDLGSLRGRIYQGVWGSAPFQRLYRQSGSTLLSLPLMPEWFLLIGVLAVLTLLGLGWRPLFNFTPILVIAVSLPIAQALLSAVQSQYTTKPLTIGTHLKLIALTTLLHLAQPMARLCGRFSQGLTPWRRNSGQNWKNPVPRKYAFWHESSKLATERLGLLHSSISATGLASSAGGEYDAWDLEVQGGLFGGARVLMVVEEHGAGCELVRYSIYPVWTAFAVTSLFIFSAIAIGSSLDGSWIVTLVSISLLLLTAVSASIDNGNAAGNIVNALEQNQEHQKA